VSGRRIFGNAAFLYLLTFSNYFLGLLLFPFLSRALSVEVFGLVGFAMAFVLIFQIIVEFGFMISATARISESRDDSLAVRRIVSATTFARVLLALLSLSLFASSVLLFPVVREDAGLLLLFLLGSVVLALQPDFYFRGVERMRTIALRTVVTRVVSIALVLIFVRDDAQVLLVPAFILLGNLIALAVSFVALARDGVWLVRVPIKEIWSTVVAGSLFFVSRLAVAFNQSMAAVFLGVQYAPASLQLGLFSGAARVAAAGELMLTPITDSLYPHMVRKRDYRLFKRVYLFGLLAWFGICVIVFIAAEPICVLLLGPDYAHAGQLLQILMPGVFLAFSSNMFGYNALSPIGLAAQANWAIVVSALVNVVAYLVLLMLGELSLVTACVVMSATNIVVFGYRALVLVRYRHRIR
jgi:O-antigen/teichoic acid export membrane protein